MHVSLRLRAYCCSQGWNTVIVPGPPPEHTTFVHESYSDEYSTLGRVCPELKQLVSDR